MEAFESFYCRTTTYFHHAELKDNEPIARSQRLAVYCASKIDTSRIPRNATMARPYYIREHEAASNVVQSLSEHGRMPHSLNISRISHFLPCIVDMQIRKWA